MQSCLPDAAIGTNVFTHAYDEIGNHVLGGANAETNTFVANCLNQRVSVLGASAPPRELAYAADFRLGTPRLKIGQPEAGLGIMAAAGATWRLKELVGEPLAKEMLLAGRILDAEEALAARLVTALHEPEDLLPAAHALADRIGAGDPLAVRLTKSAFGAPRAAHPLIDNLAQSILFESDAKFERMQAFLDRKESRRDR